MLHPVDLWRETNRTSELPFGLQAIAALARRAGLAGAPTLYYLLSVAPNAFALGGNGAEGAVCISGGLLRILDAREMVGVRAHEVSDVANGDLWIMGLADLISRVTSIASYVGQFLLLANIPLLLIGAAAIPWYLPVLLVVAPTITSLLRRALSRTREFDADPGAAQLTGDPAALAAALFNRKIAGRVRVIR